jgi:signal peptidase I
MAETTARSIESRRLHPGLAFLGGVLGLGLGYVYVGRIVFGFASVVVLYLCLFMAGWARLVFEPAGWYALFALVGLWWLIQLVHPMLLAWSRPAAPPKSYNRWWWYVAWIAGLNLASLPLSANRGVVFGYDHYFIPSMSMAPAIQRGDRVVVDIGRYRNAAPAVGEIVVCDLGDGVLVVKRVVGVPGDTIELRGALLVRNGRQIEEPYLNSESAFRVPNVASLTLGADEFFVLGDNRGNSNDSRFVGPLARSAIAGRVEHIYFSSSSGGVNWDRFPVVLSGD